jgi:serpin B
MVVAGAAIALLGIVTQVQAEGMPDFKTVVKENRAFAVDLHKRLGQREGNLFFSPYSISTALAMTYAGARGSTAGQMAKVLHFALDPNGLHAAFSSLSGILKAVQKKRTVRLETANGLWPQRGHPFLKAYLDLVKRHYGVSIDPVDFQKDAEGARRKINGWVADRTSGKIKDLIPEGVLDQLTRMALVNAIYFKGDWKDPFREDLTEDMPFWITPDVSKPVPMMTRNGEFLYGEREALQLLEIPYAGDDLSMLVLLPKSKQGLRKMEQGLEAKALSQWCQDMGRADVSVFLPRFKISSQFRLDQALKAMGMRDAFDPHAVDFSGMDGRKGRLYLNAVIHKAFVDVNERGTEAAAATGISIGKLSAPPCPTAVFRADHPFVIIIRHNQTGSVVFMGRVVNPAK